LTSEQIIEILRIHSTILVAKSAISSHWSSPSARHLSILLVIRAELIILLAFLRIRKHFVGFVDFFKFLFGRFIAWIDVGMILTCQLTISLANLLLSRFLVNA